MASVTYTAKRSLIAGHETDTQYSLDFSVVSADRTRSVDRTVVMSRGGARETLTHKRVEQWSVATVPLTATQLAALREFLDSVDDGTSFSFDPYGTNASPASGFPITVFLSGDSYSEGRAVRTGDGPNDYFQVTFSVERAL